LTDLFCHFRANLGHETLSAPIHNIDRHDCKNLVRDLQDR
jgi:hypothetical protein